MKISPAPTFQALTAKSQDEIRSLPEGRGMVKHREHLISSNLSLKVSGMHIHEHRKSTFFRKVQIFCLVLMVLLKGLKVIFWEVNFIVGF